MFRIWKKYSFALQVYLLISFFAPKILMALDSDIDFKFRANTKFQVLMENSRYIANNTNAFWQLANAFSSMAYYCSVTKTDCSEMAKLAKEIYLEKSPQGFWYDDRGWWIELFLWLYELAKTPEDKAAYLELAQGSLEIMLNAKNAFNVASADIKAEQPPRFPLGCYNTNLVLEAKNDDLTGIENSVTNLLFLNSSLELFQVFYKDHENNQNAERARIYWRRLVTQFTWFKNWFGNGLFNEEYRLIEERVSTYANQQCALGYHKNRFWLGDQGLFLRGLANLSDQISQLIWENPLNLDIKLFDVQKLSATFRDVSSAIITPNILVDNEKNLLPVHLEAEDKFPFGDDADYKTGPGNFLRNLFRHKVNLEEYLPIILVNANQAAKHADFDPTTMDAYNQVATDLALLTAAILAGL